MTETPEKPEPIQPEKQARMAGIVSAAREWLPPKSQMAALAIAGLTISNVATWVLLTRNDPPEVMTVGVREMTQSYMASIALSEITPEEAGVQMDLFMSVTQDTLQRAGRGKNVLLLARECVLAGQADDVTQEVGEAVRAAMARAGGARPIANATPAPTGAQGG
jgi:hypothetical protein